MRISCICPTYNRADKHEQLLSIFRSQTWPDLELLVYDDSPSPSKTFRSVWRDDDITYLWQSDRISIGAKRNLLCARASGDIIVQFDDDDLYEPTYVENMAARLIGYDLAKLVVWRMLRQSDGSMWRWDTLQCGGVQYAVSGDGTTIGPEAAEGDETYCASARDGYGFGMAYRKAAWRKVGGFPDQSMGEDLAFVQKLRSEGARINLIADGEEWVLHTLHEKSSSMCFPQTRLA